MKPIKLELKEFGPYKNEIIEWDKIINEPIFLITGKTGSGKSTLFDAITGLQIRQSSLNPIFFST